MWAGHAMERRYPAPGWWPLSAGDREGRAMVIVVLWGRKRRTKVLGKGFFMCPECLGEKRYSRVRSRTWFTLFYLPLFPIEASAEYVQCDLCGNTFEPSVLDSPSQTGGGTAGT